MGPLSRTTTFIFRTRSQNRSLVQHWQAYKLAKRLGLGTKTYLQSTRADEGEASYNIYDTSATRYSQKPG